jgi:hypothetical protein
MRNEKSERDQETLSILREVEVKEAGRMGGRWAGLVGGRKE